MILEELTAFSNLYGSNEDLVLAGGGTAGHINPALAIGAYIRKKLPDTQILYIGCKGGMEEGLVKKAGYRFEGITISGFKRSFSFSAVISEWPRSAGSGSGGNS